MTALGEIPPNPDPKSLAEKMAAVGSQCPIPATHDRLFEAHHWWHEMAHWYHEPEPFRFRLGAFIQAARNVTWMLQSEKAVFKDFSWYNEWVERARADWALQWLNSARVDFVKRQALEPHSWLEMRCVRNSKYPQGADDDPVLRKVSPFQCTHHYMQMGPPTDHGHNYTRHWSMDGLKGRELLEVCADVYDRLDDLVVKAHKHLGAHVVSYAREGSTRRLPCMEDTRKWRLAKTRIRRGKEVLLREPRRPHDH